MDKSTGVSPFISYLIVCIMNLSHVLSALDVFLHFSNSYFHITLHYIALSVIRFHIKLDVVRSFLYLCIQIHILNGEVVKRKCTIEMDKRSV